MYHGVRFSLQLISYVYPEPTPVPLPRDSATGNLRAQPILWFGENICHKRGKKTKLRSIGAEMMEWGRGIIGRWRIFPSVRRALCLVLLKMVQNGMFCRKPLSRASVLMLHIPLSCGLVLFVLFSMTGKATSKQINMGFTILVSEFTTAIVSLI